FRSLLRCTPSNLLYSIFSHNRMFFYIFSQFQSSLNSKSIMGLGYMVIGLFGVVEDERLDSQRALDRSRYEAVVKQAEADRE
ncbi:hypothetical protein PENTCL1PPCAC_28604, partial [Pristionchus entomophagus]